MKYNWNKEFIIENVNKSDSITDTLRNMNIPTQGNNYKTLKQKIKE